jgi:hypothetical protein
MENKFSLPYPHQIATRPHSKIAESSAGYSIPNEIHFNIISSLSVDHIYSSGYPQTQT